MAPSSAGKAYGVVLETSDILALVDDASALLDVIDDETRLSVARAARPTLPALLLAPRSAVQTFAFRLLFEVNRADEAAKRATREGEEASGGASVSEIVGGDSFDALTLAQPASPAALLEKDRSTALALLGASLLPLLT
jgi:hypothetical protein